MGQGDQLPARAAQLVIGRQVERAVLANWNELQPGTGGGGQQIAAFDANTTYCTAWNIFGICLFGSWVYQTYQLSATRLTFSYANDVIYPAGTYQGTVRFTVTLQ